MICTKNKPYWLIDSVRSFCRCFQLDIFYASIYTHNLKISILFKLLVSFYFRVKCTKKFQQFFNFRNCRFKCWRRQFCNCAHWLQSACNIKIHKTQTVSEKEWGQLKLRHIKCALLSSTNIYVFLFKLIAIMSDYTTRLGY